MTTSPDYMLQQPPLNVNSGVNWKLSSSVPVPSGLFGNEIHEIETYIQSAAITSPSGETGISFREYVLGRVLVALSDFKLAPDDFEEQRSVRSLLQRTVGVTFDNGNFQTFIQGMLESASSDASPARAIAVFTTLASSTGLNFFDYGRLPLAFSGSSDYQ